MSFQIFLHREACHVPAVGSNSRREAGTVFIRERFVMRSRLPAQQAVRIGKGHLSAPGRTAVRCHTSAILLQFVQTDRQIAKCGQRVRRCAMRDPAGILSKGHVAPMMNAVLDRRPMVANELQHLLVGMLFECRTGRIVADFIRRLPCLRVQFLSLPSDGHDLPAATEADGFRRDRATNQTPAVEPPVFLLPRSLFVRGGKPAEPAGVEPDRVFRSDSPSVRKDNPNRVPV